MLGQGQGSEGDGGSSWRLRQQLFSAGLGRRNGSQCMPSVEACLCYAPSKLHPRATT